MTGRPPPPGGSRPVSRRRFLAVAGGTAAVAATGAVGYQLRDGRPRAPVFVASVPSYDGDLRGRILEGLRELGVGEAELRGRRVLLKPNLVEPHAGAGHINTHPLVVRAAVEAFLHLGAAQVVVAEGAGHRRDALLVLESSGLAEVLHEDRIPYEDLNTGPVFTKENLGGLSRLGPLVLPTALARADLVVSLAKMKTHHWAGATLSLKNLFGVMPGRVYGWPKNVLHLAGLSQSIVDIAATVRPDLAIVDGIVGMEGDGPIMGRPVRSGVLVMGRHLPSVDATCCRIMGIEPLVLDWLVWASRRLGAPIEAALLEQRGEQPEAVRHDFALVETIPAHQGIRLAR